MRRLLSPASIGALLALALSALLFSSPASETLEPVRLLASSPEGLTLRVVPGTPRIEEGREGSPVVVLEGYGLLDEPGRPALPVRRERVAIPAGARLIVETPELEWSLHGLPAPLGPGQESLGSPVLRVTEGRVRGQRYAELWIVPVRPVPGDAAFLLARPFDLVLRFEGGVRRPRVRVEDSWAATFRGMVRNAGEAGLAAGAPGADAPPLSAQGEAGTAQITGPRWKMIVTQTGIYQLSWDYLQTAAPDLWSYLDGVDPALIAVHNLGEELPIRVEDNGSSGGGSANGVFDSGDYLEFYGQRLEWDVFDPDEFEDGDYSDTNVYWISLGTGPGARVAERPSAPTAGWPEVNTFQHTARYEGDSLFFGVIPEVGSTHWYDHILAANTTDGPDDIEYLLSTPDPTHTGETYMRVRLLGLKYTNNYHRSRLDVSTFEVDLQDWDGHRSFIHGVDSGPLSINPLLVADPETTVKVALPFDRVVPGVTLTQDAVAVDWIEIDYRRHLRANGGEMSFQIENGPDQRVKLSAYTGNDAVAYEVTEVDPDTGGAIGTHLTGASVKSGGGGQWTVEFDVAQDLGMPADALRRFIVVAPEGTLRPDEITAVELADWSDPSHDIDILVLAERSLVDQDLDGTPEGPQFLRWKALRESQGYTVGVAFLEDVLHEFSAGIFDPYGIRAFVSQAYFNWAGPPQALLIVGDATHDFKNNYGYLTQRMWVPTYIQDKVPSENITYFAWDTYFTTVDGTDVMPDLWSGRISSHDFDETEATFKKIADHGEAPTGQDWQHHVLFVAEREDPEFENVQDRQTENYLDGTPHTYAKVYEQDIVDANPGLTPYDQARLAWAEIDSEIDGVGVDQPGTAIVNFVGHGSVQQWGKNPMLYAKSPSAMETDDVDRMSNAGVYPFMMNTNCVTGGFHFSGSTLAPDRQYSLGEKLVIAAERGALAILAPSHLTQTFLLADTNNSVFGSIYGRVKYRRLGDIDLNLRADLLATNKQTEAKSYTFQGDPLSRLHIPAPAPPTGVSATGGDGFVDLAWTESPEAAQYQVYRAYSPSGEYSPLGAVAGASTRDEPLDNCRDYYYSLVSLDAAGFEGDWTHGNTDCGGAELDCLRARPEPPGPPAVPTGVVAVDTEEGGRIEVSWVAATDPPNGFRIWGGADPGNLDLQLGAPSEARSVLMGGLTDGVPHFFAVSSLNCAYESARSSPLAEATPTRVLGTKPPALIGDLTVTKDGDDLVLDWTRPAENIYGTGANVAAYDLYHSTVTPNYLLDGAHLLHHEGNPDATSYRHLGARLGANPEFYLVVSEDVDGNRSGASHELPAWIEDLTVSDLGGGLARLCWTAVEETVDGAPTLVDHYELYGHDSPIRSQMPLLDGAVGGTCVDRSLPPDDDYYWNVLVVDNHGSRSSF
jgi:hypothetical protein